MRTKTDVDTVTYAAEKCRLHVCTKNILHYAPLWESLCAPLHGVQPPENHPAGAHGSNTVKFV